MFLLRAGFVLLFLTLLLLWNLNSGTSKVILLHLYKEYSAVFLRKLVNTENPCRFWGCLERFLSKFWLLHKFLSYRSVLWTPLDIGQFKTFNSSYSKFLIIQQLNKAHFVHTTTSAALNQIRSKFCEKYFFLGSGEVFGGFFVCFGDFCLFGVFVVVFCVGVIFWFCWLALFQPLGFSKCCQSLYSKGGPSDGHGFATKKQHKYSQISLFFRKRSILSGTLLKKADKPSSTAQSHHTERKLHFSKTRAGLPHKSKKFWHRSPLHIDPPQRNMF